MIAFYQNKLKRLSLLLVCLLVQLAAAAAPKHVAVTPAPAWVKQLPQRTHTKIDPNEVSDGYHYLLRSIQWEVALGEAYYQNTYKITAEEGVQNNSELKFSFDPNYEKLNLHHITVYRNGRPINKLDLKKVKVIQREQGLEQRIYDESLTAIIFLEDIRVGDVVDYACTIKGSNPVFGGKFFNSFNLQYYDPVDELLVRVVAPEQRRINYKLYLSDQKPTLETAGGKTSYTWHAKDVPATTVDEDLPGWYDPYPGVYLSEYNTWQEVAQWGLPLYTLNEKPNKALQATIDSIKTAYTDPGEQLAAALRFVQDEVRYLGIESGIGGFKPRSPSVVHAQRFGDCKDKSLLLCVMLRNLGIEANPALVHSSNKNHIRQVQPSPYAFNHCIVQVKHQGKTLWYDPTISKQRGRYDNIAIPDYRHALVLHPATKELEAIKPSATAKAKILVEESFRFVDVGGPVKLQVKTEYFGSEADFQRSRFATTTLKDIEKAYLNFYASTYPEMEATQAVKYQDNEAENIFTTTEAYTIENLWTEQKENAHMLEGYFYPQMLRDYIRQPKASKRTMPIGLSYPLHIEQRMVLHLPETWSVTTDKNEIGDENFNFTSNIAYHHADRRATLTYTYTTLQDHVKPARAAAYIKSHKSILEDLGFSLTYNKNAAGGTVASGEVNWQLVMVAMLVLGVAAFGAYRLYLYDPATTVGSLAGNRGGEALGGWLVLPMLGILFTPLGILITLVTGNYFDKAVWENLFSPSSATYAPAFGGIVVFEMMFNLLLLVFSATLAYLFLKRRTSVPQLMIVFYVVHLLGILAIAVVMRALELPFQTDNTDMNDVIRTVIAAAIWVPYFYLSHRVKDTFVVQLQPPPVQEEEYMYREDAVF